ncbi:MAG TPA: hypothetical protein VKZ91_12720 [Woeseiaceae bacterium]|nr:hypothetical protein [Woeseiaceae bacterium]
MDKLERRLRDDALQIRADVSPDLAVRIQESLRSARPMPQARREFSLPLWLAASVTGAAAALAVIILVNVGDIGKPPEAADSAPYSVPQYVNELRHELPLRATTADLTAPLEEEMKNLRSDLERARERLERDLEFTF